MGTYYCFAIAQLTQSSNNKVARSHRTDKLEIAVQRLLALWALVQKDLETAFTVFELQADEEGKIVSTEIFKVL